MKNKKENDLSSKVSILMQKFKILNIIKYLFLYLDKVIKIFIKKPKKISNKKQVMILASFGVGDGIIFLSTIEKYRKLYPKEQYEITVVCSSKVKMLFEEETNFEHIIELNIDEGMTSISKRIKIYKKINEKYYDILIDVLGPSYCSMNVYTSHVSFAKEKITIINPEDCVCSKKIIKNAYTKTFMMKKKKANIIEYFNELVDDLSNKEEKIKFHKTKRYELNIDIPKDYYIVFPSASAETKKWDIEKFAEIIKKVYQKTNLPVIFSGGKGDKNTIEQVIKLIENDVKYYDVTCKTNLMEFIELIKRAKFCITNDSGSYHIAISESVPVAIIAGGYHYDKYINYYNIDTEDNFKKPYIITSDEKCFNCLGKCDRIKLKYAMWPCLQDITIQQAWKIIEKMIDENLKI